MLVKLGGAVLTDKTRLKALRRDTLDRLARELATSPEPLVLVHGAGSFGHIRAKEHGLKEGLTPANRAGFSRVHADVRELHLAVLDALIENGVHAVGVPPLAVARLAEGTLRDFTAAPFMEALQRGLTPVTFGDAVFDGVRGAGIVSGDALMLELGRVMRPARAIFVTNVDGIYDRDPAEAGATLIPRLAPDALLETAAGDAAAPDVTGGMRGKARHMAELARRGVQVQVLNGNVPGRVQDALAGKPVTGTVVA